MNTSSDVSGLDACVARVVDHDRVRAVQQSMPGEMDVEALGSVFGLLGDPGRLRLLIALLEGEMCVCDLSAGS